MGIDITCSLQAKFSLEGSLWDGRVNGSLDTLYVSLSLRPLLSVNSIDRSNCDEIVVLVNKFSETVFINPYRAFIPGAATLHGKRRFEFLRNTASTNKFVLVQIECCNFVAHNVY